MNVSAEPSSRRWTLDAATALAWGALAALSTVAVLPYLLQHTPGLPEKIQLPLPLFAAVQAVQGFILMALLSLVGLRMGHRVGLGSPLLQGLILRQAIRWSNYRPGHAVILGVLVGAVIIAGTLVLDPLLPTPLQPLVDPGAGRSALYGLLASFYGGIFEELLLRLFLMTLLVWLFARLSHRRPQTTAYWLAIAIAALLFGIGHLPMAAKVWELDGLVVVRTLLLNGIGGVAFGWLYWRRGIEMAMLGHFCADIVLHVLAALAGRAP